MYLTENDEFFPIFSFLELNQCIALEIVDDSEKGRTVF